ncbi:DUF1428 domain-containing protein [Arenibaculum pallidiluteum]|uniref:DUF1428 domain-containing protein n=1 Tax=Arenibaculum pallidiluteum TaxID=2812559 RepID=UPI001F2135DB|nr:DUF1428 domain-containing protein [Arenibaculum pallidiluteum]
MTYIEGFVAAVPASNRDAFRHHALDAAPLFRESGATRIVECWGDDVPDGQVTDFRRSVKAEEGEVVVFSWIEYPSRSARDAANAKLAADPRMKEIGASMPFDGRRALIGGFAAMLEEGKAGSTGYADGFLVPVPVANKEAYRAMASKAAAVFRENGATRVVEAWGDDVPDGKVTDFKGAVQARDDEAVVFSWIEWPSKQARDEGWKKSMEDPRLKPDQSSMPFDGKRMIYGGFEALVEA